MNKLIPEYNTLQNNSKKSSTILTYEPLSDIMDILSNIYSYRSRFLIWSGAEVVITA